MSATLQRPWSAGRVASAVVVALLPAAAARVAACDFCMAPLAGLGKTVREADGVARARVVNRQLLFVGEDAARVATTFEIVRVVRGYAPAAGKTHRTTLQWRGAAAATAALVLFDRTEDGPILLDALADADGSLAGYYERAFEHADRPAEARAAFYAGFLEHADAEIADDAYRQFAEIPFEALCRARASLDARRLRAWLESDQVAAARKGLYGLMLGIVGTAADADLAAAVLPQTADSPAASAGLLAGRCLLTGKAADVLTPLVGDRTRAAGCRRGALMAARFLWTRLDEAGRDGLRRVLRTAAADADLAPFAVDEFARLREDWMTDEVRRLWLDPARRSPALKPAVLAFARSLPAGPRAELYKLVEGKP